MTTTTESGYDQAYRLNVETLARLSGATATDGTRAKNIFCFTTSELLDFAKRLGETYVVTTTLGGGHDRD